MRKSLKLMTVLLALLVSVMMIGCRDANSVTEQDTTDLKAIMKSVEEEKSVDMKMSVSAKMDGVSMDMVIDSKAILSETEKLLYTRTKLPFSPEMEMYYYNGYMYSISNDSVAMAVSMDIDAALSAGGGMNLDMDFTSIKVTTKKVDGNITTYGIEVPKEILNEMTGGAVSATDAEFKNVDFSISVDNVKKTPKKITMSADVSSAGKSSSVSVSMEFVAFGSDVKIDVPQFVKDYVIADPGIPTL